MGTEVLIASLLLTGFATYKSIEAQKESAGYQREASQAQVRAAEIKSRNARLQAIREARIKRAALVAGANEAGAGVSSGAVGGAGSIESQLAGNVSNIGAETAFNVYTTEKLSAAEQAQTQANIFQSYAKIGSSVFAGAGGFETIFKTQIPKGT